MMDRLTFRSNDTTHENRICCSHFNGKECIAVCGNCSLGCKWEEEVWSKLAHYEDLEEDGRLMILPKYYDNEKFKKENCPRTLGLKEYCHEYADCDECWEAALKERESE